MKTLKDLDSHEEQGDNRFAGDVVVNIDDLRQSAIEWIKELKKVDIKGILVIGNFEFDEPRLDLNKNTERIKSIVIWIKHFFNITEDDLVEEPSLGEVMRDVYEVEEELK